MDPRGSNAPYPPLPTAAQPTGQRVAPGSGAPKPPAGAPGAYSGALPATANLGYNAMLPNGGVAPPAPAGAPGLPPLSAFSAAGGSGSMGFQNPSNPAFNPVTSPYGFDLSGLGTGEQAFLNNQNKFMDSPQLDWVDSQQSQFQDPWQGEVGQAGVASSIAAPGAGQQYWDGLQGQSNTPAESTVLGGYKGSNNAQSAFNQMNKAMPGSLQPQFDAYYDRMGQKAISSANTQAAARGSYGSNSALNGVNAAALDVEAQRAKAATDFSLADSANQRDWFNGLSGAGSAADASGVNSYNANIAGANFGLDKTKTLGDLAFRADDANFNRQKASSDIWGDVDKAKLGRLDAGVSSAFGSDAAHHGHMMDYLHGAQQTQDSREGRINSLYNQVSGLGSDVQNFVMKNYDQLLGADSSNIDGVIDSMIAKEAQQQGWDTATANRNRQGLKDAWGMANGQKNLNDPTAAPAPTS